MAWQKLLYLSCSIWTKASICRAKMLLNQMVYKKMVCKWPKRSSVLSDGFYLFHTANQTNLDLLTLHNQNHIITKELIGECFNNRFNNIPNRSIFFRPLYPIRRFLVHFGPCEVVDRFGQTVLTSDSRSSGSQTRSPVPKMSRPTRI